jgi:tetratricopeptide (TPR) repeat protein
MEHMMEGRRNFLVEDYSESVSSLAVACEMLAKQFGETANECADSYFHYGKALLELARMEGGVLGNALEGVPEGDDTEDPQVESAEKMTEDEREDVGTKVMEALEENFVEHEEKVATLLEGHKKAVDCEEEDVEEGQESMDVDVKEGEKTSGKKSEDEMEAEVENEDLSNLQRAWEVLELAKIIYTRMIKEAKNEMNEKKLCETLLTLGEVSIENENWSTAVEDLKACLTKRKELGMESRLIAETHYHLGVALCYDSKFDEAVKSLNDAKAVLSTHLQHLKTDTFNARVEEIDEVEQLLPEIDSKVADTFEMKAHPEKMKESLQGFPKSTMGSMSASAIQTKRK